MAKKLCNNCLMLILLLGICVTGFSQKVSTDDSKATVYVTINDIKVRETPPSKGVILVSGPGKETFELKKDAQVIILEKRTISTVFSETIWVRVRDLASNQEGWLYWGKEDKEEKSVNLKLKG